jgi:hypothetical protein
MCVRRVGWVGWGGGREREREREEEEEEEEEEENEEEEEEKLMRLGHGRRTYASVCVLRISSDPNDG